MIEYMSKNTSVITKYTLAHFSLTISAILISLILWIPIGVYMTRNKKVANFIFATSNILYCIPSIAMFAILITIPFLGLGRKSAIIALVLYSMMPMTRSVYTGIKNVDKSLIEAVKGMGMNARNIFWEVELPMAVPSIFSGFRIMTIMITSTATLATYIGEKNLGRLISQGLSRSNMEMVATGAILVSIITLLLDFILSKIEDKLSWYNTNAGGE
ncbi:carnitine transport permease protein OpuCB [Tissierella creatinophila DSM 6911]|uniref:Carnitine transport permease protein OpuCB n=2 Tax=Tissierella creatinophila TaxID=79681 RepID=A0A1U7M7R8_TISCR|nr:carnitine transport permease protein OpuCB [Tissierella creatinophila DSM 6911]